MAMNSFLQRTFPSMRTYKANVYRYCLLLLACIFVQQHIHAQVPVWHYQRSQDVVNHLPEMGAFFGTPTSPNLSGDSFENMSISVDDAGNSYVSTSVLAYRWVYVTKYDKDGNIIWSHVGDPDWYQWDRDGTDSGIFPGSGDVDQFMAAGSVIAPIGGVDHLFVVGRAQFDNISGTNSSFNNQIIVLVYNITTGTLASAKAFVDTSRSYEVYSVKLRSNGDLMILTRDRLFFMNTALAITGQYPSSGSVTFSDLDISAALAPSGDPSPDYSGSYSSLSATNPVQAYSPLNNTSTFAQPYDTTRVGGNANGGTIPGVYEVKDVLAASSSSTVNGVNGLNLSGSAWAAGQITGNDFFEYYSVAETSDGALYILGYAEIGSLGHNFLVRLNATDLEVSDWSYTWLGYNDNRTNLLVDENDNLYTITWDLLLSSSFSPDLPGVLHLLTKWDGPTGAVQYSKLIVTRNNTVNVGLTVAIDKTNDRIAYGMYTDGFQDEGIPKSGLAVFNYEGEMETFFLIEETGVSKNPNNVAFDPDGNIIAVGVSDGSSSGSREFVHKVNPTIQFLNPTFVSATKVSDTQITVTLSVNAATNGGNPTDFTVTDGLGTNFTVSAQADGTPGDTDIVLTVADLSGAVGDLRVTYTNNNNEITTISSGFPMLTDATGVTIDVDTSAPTLVSGKRDSDTQLTITLSEPVQTNGTNPTDFTVKDATDAAFAVSAQADGTAKDTDIILTVADFSGATGPLTITYTNTNGEIKDFGGNELTTDATGIDVLLLAAISNVSLAADNDYIDVTFNQGVYNTNGGSGALEASDFNLDISGGLASGPTISSVKKNDNAIEGSAAALAGGETVIRIFFSTTGTPDGSEVLTVTPVINQVFDVAGNASLTTQSNNTATLNDRTRPTVAITSNASNPQNGAFTATFTFSEAVSDFVVGDLTVGNGAASNFQTTSADVYTATITPASDGAVTVDVAADAANDAAGNGNTAATQLSVTNDETDPTVVITSSADPTSGAFTATFTFSEAVSDFVIADLTVGNGAAGNFQTTSAAVYTATITPASDGAVTVDVAADAANDAAGNGNTAATQLSVTNDETNPTVVITSSADPTSGAFTATFTFSEAVSDFVVGDLTVGNGAASNFQTTSADVYTATITPASDGAVTVDVAADAANDAAGNGNTAATQLSVTNDETNPTVVITSSTDPTSAAFTATFTFSEAVSDFVMTDITVGNGVASNFQTTSADVYTATITPASEGAVTVDIAANATNDAAGNGNTAATQLSVTNDETNPTVVITSSADPTSGAFTATFTFSEAVSDFVIADITVGNGVAGNFQTTSADVYTATITPASEGAVTIDVAADAANDAAGNDNIAAMQLSVINDETSPQVLEVTTDAVNGTFGVGDELNIYVQYGEEVVVSGTPQLALETGATDRVIDYADRSVSTLRFVYTVQGGDEISDLDVLSSSALSLNGGTIEDIAGNAAGLEVPHGATAGSLSSNKDILIDASFPTVTTSDAVSVIQSSATLGGDVTAEGGSAVTERGVVYSATATNNDPEIGGAGVTQDANATGTGEFSEVISGLSANTGYSFRAYAMNSSGTVYGMVKTFLTPELVTSIPVDEWTNPGMLVYPNPASDELYINISADKVQFMDIAGRIIEKKVVNGVIDVSDLQIGTYQIKVSQQTVRFIKQ